MKATDLLQNQHRDIEALLQRLRGAGQGDERALRQELAATLVAHTVIEEESFYPALRDALPEEINEAIEEHGLADVELARLLAARPGDETAEAKVTVLSEIVINHLRREESDVFPTAERELGGDALDALGDVMAQRFGHVLDTGYQKHLQKALDERVPRASRRVPAKKAARRAPSASAPRASRKKAPRLTAKAKRAASAPATRRARPTSTARATRKRGESRPSKQARPGTAKAKRTRASAAATRTRA